MNLRSIDLNLLVVLDALLDERHVTRAAVRVGLSQPATSSALERCRHLFHDQLLERGAGGMRLTPRAESLREPLKTLLAGTLSLIDPPAIDLSEIEQTVRVIMADTPSFGIVSQIYAQLMRTAPGIRVVIQPWHGADAALEALAKGHADLAVSVFSGIDENFHCHEILFETYALAMRRDHPAAKGFDLEQWLAYPHVVVSGRGEVRTPLDDALGRMGLARRVGIVVPNFLMVRPLLLASDLIAMVPRRALSMEGGHGLAVFEPPIPVTGFPLNMAWHIRRDQDQAVRHVADLVEALVKAL
ncbi:LysR family transcriptional regulator [Mesorhizobium sp. B2-3-5]|uniref:LysR family transcriptional regulator n=1 Tax=Mesorhizobium sp. B2-3-5 TaxID=2589958 RepID=UPI00112D39FC|nr:LysR family transcriptional regulator [Mesorhizobium sp. B2-3-5]TPM16334.1 LysR family transcriptional regulator [Mesorhizobium sp. B2-3-5]